MRSVYMRIAHFALVALAASLVACGDPPAPQTPAQKTPTREESCVVAARACSKHVFDGHPEGLVDCMPDEIVKRFGGREKLIETMNASRDNTQPDIEDTVIEAPSQMQKSTPPSVRTFAIVPQTVAVKVPEGRLMLKSYLLGVSADDGRTWKFVDGVELDRPKALTLFPDLPEGFTLPKVGEPELIPTDPPKKP